MRTVQLDEDVYEHIASRTQEIGESASSILRRLLGLRTETKAAESSLALDDHELSKVLSLAMFRSPTPAVKRYLRILKEVHDLAPERFKEVLAIQGRNRSYFGLSSQDVSKTGRSTQPRQIPGTKYWALTNSPTSLKREVLRNTLEKLGYSTKAIDAAAAALE